MAANKFNTKTLDELTDKYIGQKGSAKRDQFEFDLELDRIGETIRSIRKRMGLTQGDLGKLIGVQKAQVSKVENNTRDVRLSTIMKTFRALNAKLKVSVELDAA